MGEEAEYLSSQFDEYDVADEFQDSLDEWKEKLSKRTDERIIDTALSCGKNLNKVTDHFPAYDVALKLKKNNWKPTTKQRQAIINVTAFYLVQKEYGEI